MDILLFSMHAITYPGPKSDTGLGNSVIRRGPSVELLTHFQITKNLIIACARC